MKLNGRYGVNSSGKFVKIITQKKLESIKMLLMFKLAKGQEIGWTVAVMQRHEKEMLDLLQLEACGQ